ncbi:MAG: thioredoxin domain-containing protein [Gammaproteobacteria bacterium]|nr:thioredoxin domain-containing protein [Gammaproteobacteria bacterium]
MTKSSDKKLKREEKKQQAKRRQHVQKSLFTAFVVLMIPIALYVFYQGLFGGAPVYPPDEVSITDHVQGEADAPLTITVYGDFQCPNCANEANIISQAWPLISNRARVVFRHYPLDSYPHSFEAARYAEAAGRQDAFWEFYSLLYGDQNSWAVLPDATIAFENYAEQLELDIDQLREDAGLSEIREKILADQRGGNRAGVRATPATYFNGEIMASPRTASELIQMVNDFLSE